jgi:hypothetical protein
VRGKLRLAQVEHVAKPFLLTFLVGAAVIIAGALIVNWEAISVLNHLPQIKRSFGL